MKKLNSIILILLSLVLFDVAAQEAENSIEIKGDALFGGMRARHIGPGLMSGRVTDLAGHPTDVNTLYVGAAGGGVWKSTNGGITFSSVFDEYCQSIGAITVDPVNPETVWVGTGEIWTRNSTSVGDGLYKTDDGGKNWKKIAGFDDSERISSIQINPNNNQEIYVGVLGALYGDSETRGVYKTTDGGENWEKLFFVNETTGCSDLVMDMNNPNILYAAFWEFRRTPWSFNSGGENSALYKSTDGGAKWKKIHNGYPEGKLGRIAVALAPSNSNVLYSVIETEDKSKNGLYRSDDAGKKWEQLNKDFELTVRPFYFSRIVVSPHDEDVLCKAGLSGSISKDGGKTFRSFESGVHSDVHDFHFDLKNPDRMYCGSDGGVYRSWDLATSFDMVKGLPLSQPYHVTTDNSEPFKVFTGLQDNGSWVGVSAKAGGITEGDWQSVGYGDGFRVYPHPENSNICYSEMQGAEGVWRVDIDKKQSKTIKPYAVEGDPKLRFNWNTPMTTSAFNADCLYIGSQYLHKSDDMGETWTKISGDLTTNNPEKQKQAESGGLSADNSGAENHCTIFSIAESALDQNVIWVGTDDGNIQLTKNGGASWEEVGKNIKDIPEGMYVYHIEPSSFDKNTAYAVFDGHQLNDGNTYAFKTSDAGKTWTSIVSDDIVGFARSIQEDFVNPDLLYLGTEFGLYITVDGGKNWSKFTNNMPSVPVHHVTLHKRDDALVLATHGRGIIIIDDVTPLRQLTPEVAQEKLYFFDQGEQIIKEDASFGGNAQNGDFVGENPSTSAKIVYYMKSRHTFGKMTLKIFDAQGKEVADLAPSKAKGVNMVKWNYRYVMPKIAKAKTFTFGGFTTPTVPPGKYKVVLTKGKETFESHLTLVADPNSIHSDSERAAQHKAAMKLYNMNEDLAFHIDRINAMDEGLKAAIKDQVISEDLASQLDAFSNKVEETKTALVITTGDNYVGAAEPQLREKIASLYGEVAGYQGKPTNAQMENLKLLSGQLTEAMDKFSGIEKSFEKLNSALGSLEIAPIKLLSKEEFLMAD